MTEDIANTESFPPETEAPTAQANPEAEAEAVVPAQTAENIQMVSPSPLGAIEKSKALISQTSHKRKNLMPMMDVPIELVMEVGRTHISVEQLMELVEGSIINLRKVSVDSIEVRMNERVIAQAEAIALQGRYGVRFTSLEKMPVNEEEESDEL
jgi:flagellar motor switch protein FliN/FliY